MVLIEDNRLDEAAANLEAAQQRLPDYWAIYYDLGKLDQRQKEPTDAAAMPSSLCKKRRS